MNKWDFKRPVSFFKALGFLLLPAVFLFFALPFNRTHFGNDPEYAYLMNGINIGMLKPVGHTDNPGTTVQIYSAVVLRCAWLVQPDKSGGFQKYVLRNADKYIEVERKGLILINSLVMILLGIISWIMLRNFWLSLILQIMPFTSANLTEHLFTKVAPEPVLYMASAALVLLIINYYTVEKRDDKRYALYFAVVFGFGLATKATFLPLIVIPILLLEGNQLKKRFLLLVFSFFVLFTFPAVPQYPHMAKWLIGLTTHTGTYGEGSWGIFNLHQYKTDLVNICLNNPELLITLLFALTIVIVTLITSTFYIEFKNNLIFRIIIALSLALLAGILMVAKHYHANHYLVPELCLMATTWIFMYLFLKEKLPSKYRKYIAILPVLLILISYSIVFKNSDYLQKANQGYILSNLNHDIMTQLVENEYKEYTIAYYYPTSVNLYSALRWGNVYSKFNHTAVLKSIYPDGYFFDNRTNYFSLWETPVATSTMLKISQNKLLIIGGPLDEPERAKIQKSGLKLTKIFQGYPQIIYRVGLSVNSESRLN